MFLFKNMMMVKDIVVTERDVLADFKHWSTQILWRKLFMLLNDFMLMNTIFRLMTLRSTADAH